MDKDYDKIKAEAGGNDSGNETGKVDKTNKIGKSRLYLLIIIVDRPKGVYVTDILSKNNMKIQFYWLGEGTANSDILDLLGLGSADKSIILCVVPENYLTNLTEVLSKELKLEKPGRGIMFTIPLSGAGVPGTRVLDEDRWGKWQNEMEREVNMMNINMGHDLIVAVIDQGDSEKLMMAAKTAGATGGTMFHALRIGMEGAEKFFGISVQAKKDVVTILTKRENKEEIMKAISNFCDVQTRNIVFSLPVESVFGLTQMDEISK